MKFFLQPRHKLIYGFAVTLGFYLSSEAAFAQSKDKDTVPGKETVPEKDAISGKDDPASSKPKPQVPARPPKPNNPNKPKPGSDKPLNNTPPAPQSGKIPAPTPGKPTPLIFEFEKEVEFTHHFVLFDLFASGSPMLSSWVKPNVAFLALDLNGNGMVDDGSELFGSGTILRESQQKAQDGFEALRQYHAPEQAFIDVQTPVFSRLMLWFPEPVTREGASPRGKLLPLSDLKIFKIFTEAQFMKDVVSAPQSYVLATGRYLRKMPNGSIKRGVIKDVVFDTKE